MKLKTYLCLRASVPKFTDIYCEVNFTGEKKGGFVYLLFWVDSILLGHTDSMAKASTVNSCPAGTEVRRSLQGVLLNLVS